MPFDPEFLELMPSTVSISTRTAHNNYGEATYSTVVTKYRARVVAAPRFVRTASQEVVEIATEVWVASTKAIDTKAKITLPDGTTPPIVTADTYPDQFGNHHVKLGLGY